LDLFFSFCKKGNKNFCLREKVVQKKMLIKDFPQLKIRNKKDGIAASLEDKYQTVNGTRYSLEARGGPEESATAGESLFF
jgi:hypothetical protein